jgi:peptide-methionine (R)-S-oxide reductase
MLLLILAFTIASCSAQQRRIELPSADAQHSHTDTQQRKGENRMFPIQFTEEELRERLDDKQYRVMCEGGTEAPFSGKYNKFYEKGRYLCSACGHELFRSEHKYDSGSGWPSFWAPVDTSHVATLRDLSLGMIRDEVVCAQCGGHLGHVFPDGPQPTGLRYCINSVSLNFEADNN